MMSRFGLLAFFGFVLTSEFVCGQWSPAETEVMVVGSPHLWQEDQTDKSKLATIQKKLARFAPQLVAVEWLHPSIDPEATDNYSKLGDARTLAKLWGLKRKELTAQIDELTAKAAADSDEEATLRIKLGKLHYLAGDSLNAGYQWWLASKLGADTVELARLTSKNFAGHELEVFGFQTAFESRLQRLTPFDYQGRDADWNTVYGELIEAVTAAAVPEDSGSAEEVAAKRKAFLAEMQSNPPAWVAKYGKTPALIGFAKTVSSTLNLQKTVKAGEAKHPLGAIGYSQTAECIALQHQLYYEELWNLPHNGLGRQLVVNYERRNEKMANFIEHDARVAKAKRILVVVGAGHKMFLDNIFKQRGYRVRDSAAFLSD